MLIESLASALAMGIGYRLRGGGWISLGNTVLARLLWCVVLCLGYALASGFAPNIFYLIWLFPLAYFSMMVPHAYCQNMGRWPRPQKNWPSWFMPTLTVEQWTAFEPWQRALYDFTSMAAVACIRGLIVFPLYLLAEAIVPHPSVTGDLFFTATRILCAVGALTLLQPLGYLLGWLVPVTFTSGLQKRSSAWGELFNGAAWFAALLLL